MQVNPLLQKASSSRVSTRAKWSAGLTFVERNRPVIESWLLLFYFELIMKFRSSQALRRTVRNQRVRPTKPSGTFSSEELSHAMDLACVFFYKRVLCLQRSAATTILLRRYGWRAEMVTGAQILPFESHAWVELDGVVVNDKPYMHEIYQVLERC
jgi:hypothetical protein